MRLPGGFAVIDQMRQRLFHALQAADFRAHLIEPSSGNFAYGFAIGAVLELQERGYLRQGEPLLLRALDEPNAVR